MISVIPFDLPISSYFVPPIGDIPARRKSHPNCTYCEAGAKLRSKVLVCPKCDLAARERNGMGEVSREPLDGCHLLVLAR